MSIFGPPPPPQINLQLYTAAFVYVNGQVLAEEAKVSVKRDLASQPVHTVDGAYAGEAPGSPTCDITVESNVPASGFELDAGFFMGFFQRVEFSIFAASDVLTFKGYILNDNFEHAANTASKVVFSARGQFSNTTSQWNPA